MESRAVSNLCNLRRHKAEPTPLDRLSMVDLAFDSILISLSVGSAGAMPLLLAQAVEWSGRLPGWPHYTRIFAWLACVSTESKRSERNGNLMRSIQRESLYL